MPITCPCCRAANAAGPACRRCKADLVLLFDLDARRDTLLAAARSAAAAGDLPAALEAAAEAAQIRRGSDSSQLLAALHLLNRDFASAVRCYHEAGKSTR
jgi:hypothetical protein